MVLCGAIAGLAVIIVGIILLAKGCSGGTDALAGTWAVSYTHLDVYKRQMCMLLFAVLMQAVGTVAGPGQPEAWGVFGAMLLREDAGGYVLVAVVSFAAAVVITCLLYTSRCV